MPQIYWIPKLHKTPYRARFIAGSSSCTMTRLCKLITECLQLVRSHCTTYCKTIRERTGVNCMWIINNSLDVIRALEEKQLSLNHVSTWDFSTLYTSLLHAQLKKQLHDLLERVLNTKGKSFIATNNFRTFWANDKTSTRYTYFSCRELGLAIDFLIDNIYVRFGSSVFRQVIGIPMGTNSAPLLADLFLDNPAYGVYISQLVRYARICTSKVDFVNRLRGLSLRLRQQGFETNRLQNSLTKFVNRHGFIVEKYGAALREMRLAIQA